MHYLFDGSFDGLMTVVFDTYRRQWSDEEDPEASAP